MIASTSGIVALEKNANAASTTKRPAKSVVANTPQYVAIAAASVERSSRARQPWRSASDAHRFGATIRMSCISERSSPICHAAWPIDWR